MSTRKVPLEVVQEHLQEESWEDTVLIGTAPGTDELGEEHWGIFEYEGKFYRVKYTWGSHYYMSEVGEWGTPFPQADFDAAEIEVEEVTCVPVTTYRYDPVD